MAANCNTPEIRDFIIKNYPKYGVKHCAAELGISNKRVRNFAIRNKLKLIPKFHVEDFENIKDPLICYLLGIIWSDGTVSYSKSTVSFSMAEEDAMEIAEFIKPLGEFSFCKSKPKKEHWKTMVKVSIYSKKITDYLISMDYNKKIIL